MSTGWDGVSDFYEDDEPADAVLTLRRPTIAAVTARPVTAIDVAQEILSQTGPMDAWKLQKLCFYSQVAHLVAYGQPLFRERIEAWAQGPVVRELHGLHRKKFSVSSLPTGDAQVVLAHPTAAIAVRYVLARYESWTGSQLSELTHREQPWRDARGDLPLGAWSNAVIGVDGLASYYRDLWMDPDNEDEQQLSL